MTLVKTPSHSKLLAPRESLRELTRADRARLTLRSARYVAMGRLPDPSQHHKTGFWRPAGNYATYGTAREWWERSANWARLGVCVCVLMTLLLLLDVTTTGALIPLVLLIMMCTNGLVMLLGLGYQLLPAKRHKRVYVNPLYWTVNTEFHVPHFGFAGVRTGLVHVPRDFRDNHEALIQINLPPYEYMHPARERDKLVDVVRLKLEAPELEPTWHWAGHRPYVTFKAKPRPPRLVPWRDVADVAEQLRSDTQVFIGIGAGSTPVCLDLENDSPHFGCSAMSRGGKSETLKVFGAQVLALGAELVIIDPKFISHPWANDVATNRRLPGIRYCRQPDEIYRVLRWLATQELADRKQRVLHGEDPGCRLFVLIDEMNLVKMNLNQFWRETLEGRGPNPATGWLLELLCTGAALKMHVICAGQRLSAKTFGDPDARENLGTVMLTKWSAATWNMFARDIRPVPKKTDIKGRWQIITGGQAIETQVALMSDQEAIDLVISSPFRSNKIYVPSERTNVVESDEPLFATIVDDTMPDVPVVPEYPDTSLDQAKDRVQVQAGTSRQIVTLREATELCPKLGTLDALKQDRKRCLNDGKPYPPVLGMKGNAELYDLEDLKRHRKVASDEGE